MTSGPLPTDPLPAGGLPTGDPRDVATAPGGPAAPHRSPARTLGCVVGALVLTLTVLLVVGVVLLERAGQREADVKAGIELTSGGGYGAPLAPGQTATYEDGVRATVGEARRIPPVPRDPGRRPGHLTYAFSVTYVNGGDRTVEVSGYDDATAGRGGVGDLAGLAHDPENPRTGDDWFPETLAPGERVTVLLRFNVPANAAALTFDTQVTEEYRELARWELPLRT
ncbi:hypothetical protein [Streptomyces sp. NPDC006368]|uniref:hypothetical protein n=1 Tax=Streptomyces sp. NPDC006368 TaxID=3156760 RepID=UPI0033BB926F